MLYYKTMIYIRILMASKSTNSYSSIVHLIFLQCTNAYSFRNKITTQSSLALKLYHNLVLKCTFRFCDDDNPKSINYFIGFTSHCLFWSYIYPFLEFI